MFGTSIQQTLQSKYSHLYVVHIERDRALNWSTEEPTPVIMSDDFHFTLGILKGYLIKLGDNLKGDVKCIENLQDFLQITHNVIEDSEEVTNHQVLHKQYEANIKLDTENSEFEMVFEYLSSHLYINIDRVDTASIYMLMDKVH